MVINNNKSSDSTIDTTQTDTVDTTTRMSDTDTCDSIVNSDNDTISHQMNNHDSNHDVKTPNEMNHSNNESTEKYKNKRIKKELHGNGTHTTHMKHYRSSTPGTAPPVIASELFQYYRSIGTICDKTPIHLKYLGTERFVTCSIGHQWYTYNLDKLRVVVSSSTIQPSRIRSIVSMKEWTFTTCENHIWCYKKNTLKYTIGLKDYTQHNIDSDASTALKHTRITRLYLFGTQLLALLDDPKQTLCIYDVTKLVAPRKKKNIAHTTARQEQQQSKKQQAKKRRMNDDEVDQTREEDEERSGSVSDSDSESGNENDVKAEQAKPLTPSPSLLSRLPPLTLLSLNIPSCSDTPNRHVTSITHPTTYLNKLVFGYSDGTMELWNIHTQSKIYTFQHHLPNVSHAGDDNNTKESHEEKTSAANHLFSLQRSKASNASMAPSITYITQSTAIDIIAIGYSSGDIVIHHLKYDKPLIHFKQNTSVTSLSFRTDNVNYLVSGSVEGHMYIWNLEKKGLQSIIVYAHTQSVTSMYFLNAEPLLVTSGADNSLKVWVFDSSAPGDGACRLLKHRTSHSSAPHRVKFYTDPQNTKLTTILSSGTQHDRSLRSQCIERDQQAYEYTQGNIERIAKSYDDIVENYKLSFITDFHSILLTQRQGGGLYPNIVSIHSNDTAAYLWYSHSKSLDTNRRLINTHLPASVCTAVCLDARGNVALIGHADGRIDKFNIQSTLYRHSYGADTHINGQTFTYTAERHHGAVSGVCVDALNIHVISTSLDGTVRWWSFTSTRCEHSLTLSSPINKLSFNRENNLFAVVCDDFTIHVIDASTREIVRQVTDHHHTINDVVFSSDGRWLITASMDSTVRVFDLATGQMIDWLSFNKPVTCLAFSPNNHYLLTTHINHGGIQVWVNRMFFQPVYFKSRIQQPTDMDPIHDESEDDMYQHSISMEKNDDNILMDEDTMKLLHASATNDWQSIATANRDDDRFSLISYSALPRSQWHTLAHLDAIRQRNKPKEPPKQAPSAPFFLTAAALSGTNTGGQRVDADVIANEGGVNHELGIASKIRSSTKKKDEDEVSQDGDPSHDTTTSSSSVFASDKVPLIRLLERADDVNDYTDVLKYMKSLTPSQLDASIRQVGENDWDHASVQHELGLLLNFISLALKSRQNFEFIQSILTVLLRIHGDTLTAHPLLLGKVHSIKEIQSSLWNELQSSFHSNINLIHYLSNNYML